MNETADKPWEHSHTFGQDVRRPGESRTLLVIAITAVMMVVEVAAGIVYGSMALLADGLHMASHAMALGINAFAYVHARRHALDARYSFGTGKVNTLGGYTGAVLLAGFALVMAWESIVRFISPTPIAFNQAIFVAVLGLVVNGVCVLILGVHHHDDDANEHADEHDDDHGHDHDHAHAHDHDHDHAHRHAHVGERVADAHSHVGAHEHAHHHDHNLASAYLHVLADALTSLLAIFALLAAKLFGWVWADPAMGLIGAVLVGRWSLGLLRTTSVVLLDREAPDALRDLIRKRVEAEDGNRVTDLHVWAIGPRLYSVILGVATTAPRPPDYYKRLLPRGHGIVHTAIEVHAVSTTEIERVVRTGS